MGAAAVEVAVDVSGAINELLRCWRTEAAPGVSQPSLNLGVKPVKTFTLSLAILAVGLSAARGQDTGSNLKALDAKLTAAFIAHDYKMLDNHTDDDFMMIDPRGGTHNKKGYFKYLSAGKSTLSDMKETDVTVRDFGDTAVVSGLLHVKGKVEGKEVSPEYRWTRVYNKKKKGDEWHCVLEQHTYVVPKDDGK